MTELGHSPRLAAFLRIPEPERSPALLIAAGTYSPGDEPPPFIASTFAGERVEVTTYSLAGALPILETETGARYVAWAVSTPNLTPLRPELLTAPFLRQRLAELRTELAVLGLDLAKARTGAEADRVKSAYAPLELDALLIEKELQGKAGRP